MRLSPPAWKNITCSSLTYTLSLIYGEQVFKTIDQIMVTVTAPDEPLVFRVAPRAFIRVPMHACKSAVAPGDSAVGGCPLYIITRASCERLLDDDGCVADRYAPLPVIWA